MVYTVDPLSVQCLELVRGFCVAIDRGSDTADLIYSDGYDKEGEANRLRLQADMFEGNG